MKLKIHEYPKNNLICMTKKITLFLFISFVLISCTSQKVIQKSEIVRIETKLASDAMQGREVFTPGIDSASAFIEKEFAKIGLSTYKDLKNYRQEFTFKEKNANNVIGMLTGKSKPNEYVILSAHYDHLGLTTDGDDQVYNGANDDASGVTAVIALAQYFKKLGNNERTIIFVAFTAEEIGIVGSKHFSKGINPEEVVAMFNIEMIGTESKWGRNSAYITGFEKSDFGTILQKNLEKSKFKFYPDPYLKMKLFYRSDNAVLASLGVPAHTISTSKMDEEKNYHQASDEVSTLDLDNMTEIIKAIAISSESIINGKDTPTRVEKR